MDATRRGFTAGPALLTAALAFAALVAAGGLLQALSPIAGLVAGELAMIAVVFGVARLRGVPASDLGFRRLPRSSVVLSAAGAAALALAAAHFAVVQDAWLRAAGHDPSEGLKRLEEFLGPMLRDHPFIAFMTVVMLAPFAEEAVFRGVLLQGLWSSWGPKRALFVTSLC